MFRNIYWKRILRTLRDKATLFWTWIFPIIMATLFYVVFANLDVMGQLHEIPLGVIDTESYQQDISLHSALESVSDENGDTLFTVSLFGNTDEADIALENGDIDGYVLYDLMGDDPTLVVSDDGLNQTLAKRFLDGYLQIKNSVSIQATERLSSLLEEETYTKEISLSNNPPTEKVNYYYALLAMMCLYGGFQGLITVTYLQSNLSPLGARQAMAPVGRMRMVAYDLLGGLTMHFLCLLIAVAYIIFVLGTDFGSKLWLVLLTCFVGSVLGVAFGAMVSLTSKLKEAAKVALLITVTMVCCFLSGLMVGGVNYTVAEKAPVVAWLNPAARITDAFYCLYYYDTYERFFLNIGIILIMALAMLTVTALFVRRQRYDSI
ncbi:MAG: ABC transporter permease [Peptococcaceae bacterium]|nr:ABC transporter permease [Peptococcaceae bacterium]